MDTEQERSEPELIEDPVEFTRRFLESNTFKEEYDAFKENNPIPPDAIKELTDKSPESQENYQKYRFLAQHGEDLIHVFTSFENVRLKYSSLAFPREVKERINNYVNQVKDLNDSFNQLSVEERTRYSDLRSSYHNESGDAIAEFLTQKGVLPNKPFPDSLPLRSVGRGITSMVLRSRLPYLDNLESYT